MFTTASVVRALTEGGIVSVDDGADLDGSIVLRLPFFEARASVRRRSIDDTLDFVFFDGELPSGVGRADLRHQGALSALAQLREQKLGIQEVDDAFIVTVDDAGFALLTRCRDELRALVQRGVSSSATVQIGETLLRLAWPLDSLAAVPRLWEKLVSLRAGG